MKRKFLGARFSSSSSLYWESFGRLFLKGFSICKMQSKTNIIYYMLFINHDLLLRADVRKISREMTVNQSILGVRTFLCRYYKVFVCNDSSVWNSTEMQKIPTKCEWFYQREINGFFCPYLISWNAIEWNFPTEWYIFICRVCIMHVSIFSKIECTAKLLSNECG